MLYILMAVIIFGILIALHEFGHFITAKLLGVRVNEFAIGMGPLLWSATRGGDPVFPPGHSHRRLLRHGRGGRGHRRPGQLFQ